MKKYSPGEVATAIGISASSVRNWTEQSEIRKFLSDMALRINDYEHSKQREYTLEDLYVMNTVAKEKTRHNSWQDVADILLDGQIRKDLPVSASLVMQESVAENFADKIMLHQRIEFLELSLEKNLQDHAIEIDRLQKRFKEVRDEAQQHVKEGRDEAQQRIREIQNYERQRSEEERKTVRREQSELQQEIIDLNRQIARLELRLEIVKERNDEEKK